MSRQSFHQQRWREMVRRICGEFQRLPTAEVGWLRARLREIAEGQQAIDRLFHEVGGMTACAKCSGACCGSGRHHFTLPNLLVFLVEGALPPEPDFTRPCPFLGRRGCLLPVDRRPYNCITFFCETLDTRLSRHQEAALEELDQSVRQAYEAVAERYAAASMRGLWLAMERCGDRSVFSQTASSVVK